MVEKGEEFSAQLEKAGKDLQETDWYELSPERIEAEEVLEEER